MHFGKPKLLLALLASASLAACQQSGGAGNQAAGTNTSDAPGSASGGSGAQAPAGTIAQTVSQSADHSTLLGALKAVGLVETLQGAGPYTVFAPVNGAFQKLAPGTAESLMAPDAKADLTNVLIHHVVPGVVTSKDLSAAIERGGGKAQLATMGGATLTVSQANGAITVTDPRGGQARVTQADHTQSNGVVHSVDAVLMPKEG
jgi:uncharacterized surface protein with fasciclin (FAS1) repeats